MQLASISQGMLQILYKFLNPLPNDKILDTTKLEEFVDNSIKFNENGIKFSKREEKTVGKGEIAH